jgi:hypothetical protein
VLGIFALGFRHGFDVDHVAAITDISGSQFRRLRAFVLCGFYAVGHALVVIVLGLGIAWAGWEVPDAGRLIGATLVILGLYVLWCAATDRRPQSRGGLIVAATRWLRVKLRPTTVVEHEHPHGHGAHDRMHDHAHAPGVDPALSPSPSPSASLPAVAVSHRHRHRHEAAAPYGTAGAIVVGLVHGVGAETPTQVLALAAGTASLAPFLLGLFLANMLVAAVAVVGLTDARLRLLNALVGGFSLCVGIPYLLGSPPPLAW